MQALDGNNDARWGASCQQWQSQKKFRSSHKGDDFNFPQVNIIILRQCLAAVVPHSGKVDARLKTLYQHQRVIWSLFDTHHGVPCWKFEVDSTTMVLPFFDTHLGSCFGIMYFSHWCFKCLGHILLTGSMWAQGPMSENVYGRNWGNKLVFGEFKRQEIQPSAVTILLLSLTVHTTRYTTMNCKHPQNINCYCHSLFSHLLKRKAQEWGVVKTMVSSNVFLWRNVAGHTYLWYWPFILNEYKLAIIPNTIFYIPSFGSPKRDIWKSKFWAENNLCPILNCPLCFTDNIQNGVVFFLVVASSSKWQTFSLLLCCFWWQ